jgi:hypothetical protein
MKPVELSGTKGGNIKQKINEFEANSKNENIREVF